MFVCLFVCLVVFVPSAPSVRGRHTHTNGAREREQPSERENELFGAPRARFRPAGAGVAAHGANTTERARGAAAGQAASGRFRGPRVGPSPLPVGASAARRVPRDAGARWGRGRRGGLPRAGEVGRDQTRDAKTSLNFSPAALGAAPAGGCVAPPGAVAATAARTEDLRATPWPALGTRRLPAGRCRCRSAGASARRHSASSSTGAQAPMSRA